MPKVKVSGIKRVLGFFDNWATFWTVAGVCLFSVAYTAKVYDSEPPPWASVKSLEDAVAKFTRFTWNLAHLDQRVCVLERDKAWSDWQRSKQTDLDAEQRYNDAKRCASGRNRRHNQ